MSAGFWGRFLVWQCRFYGAEAFWCSRAWGKSRAPSRCDRRRCPLLDVDTGVAGENSGVLRYAGPRENAAQGKYRPLFFRRIRPTIPISPQGGGALRALREESIRLDSARL